MAKQGTREWLEERDTRFKNLIPEDIELIRDRDIVLLRSWSYWMRYLPDGRVAYLDHRLKGEMIHRYCRPLSGFGAELVKAEAFTDEEVSAYMEIYELDLAEVCLFESIIRP